MGGSSGLAPLSTALERHADVVRVSAGRRDKAMIFAMRVARFLGLKRLWNPTKSFSPFHDWQKAAIESAAMRMVRKTRFDAVVFESVEDCFARFGTVKFEAGQTKLVGITHHPPAWWRMLVQNAEPLRAFDRLVVLSDAAKTEIGKQLPGLPVTFLRHGVAFDFFSPTSSGVRSLDPEEPVDVVFCGHWLRDFKCLEEFVAASQKASRKFRFHLVVPAMARKVDAHYRLAMYDNVRWHTGLSDVGLRDLYRSSHLLLLPLMDATANNALLEAAACQLPILVTSVGGTRDYLDETSAAFISARPPLDQLMDCVNNYELCRQKATNARKRVVETCDWDIFAKKLLTDIGWHIE